MKVPVNQPVITAAAKKYVAEAMDSGWVSSAGKYIELFEKSFADYLGVKHAVAVTNGTHALHLALVSLGVGEGDEVIVPDFTMFSSVAAILYTGAVPVFIDAEPETFTIDTAQIGQKITKKTKAIMPVHIYGHSADMDPVMALAKKHQLHVIEDAAEAHGARYKNKKCGSIGHINAFSFYGNKIITTGEGGMVTTNDDQLAAKARLLKDLAHSPEKRFRHDELGFNYRMTNLQAACGLGQMEHIDEFVAKKQWMDAEYRKCLSDIKGLRLPITKPWATNVFWMYAVVLDDDFPVSKDAFRAKLLEKGVDTRDFFYSSASQPVVRKMIGDQGSFPVSEKLAERGLYLPSGLAITQPEIEYVCDSIHQILR